MKMDKYGNVLGKGEREGEQDTDIKVQQEQEKRRFACLQFPIIYTKMKNYLPGSGNWDLII